MSVPYVLTTHGTLDDWCMRRRPLRKRIYYRLLERHNIVGASRIHATARGEADQYGDRVPHDRVSVIPYALDLAPFVGETEAGAASPGPSLDQQSPSVLFLSRLHPKKGPEIVIEAAAMLRRRGMELELVMAGPGHPSYVARLRKLAATLAQEAEFVGLLTGDSKLAHYRRSTVLALPTHQENVGLVLLEALACGTPVVTTRGTDIWPELEESGGAVLVERSAAAFADAIGELLGDPERRSQMGEAGRRWVFDWLNPEPLVRRYEELYETAATWHPEGRPRGNPRG